MTETQFEQFLQEAYEETNAKQKILIEECDLNKYDKYLFSKANKTITFKSADRAPLTFDVACIGLWDTSDQVWTWAWANEGFTEEIKNEASKLKELEVITGYEVFGREGFECEEVVARDLAYISVKQLGAQGIYRIMIDESYLFLALKEAIDN